MDTKKLYRMFHECYEDKIKVDEVITFVRSNSTNVEQQVILFSEYQSSFFLIYWSTKRQNYLMIAMSVIRDKLVIQKLKFSQVKCQVKCCCILQPIVLASYSVMAQF